MNPIGTRTLIGVLLGGISGYALSQIDVLRKKSVGPSAVYVGGFTVAGMTVGGLVGNSLDTQDVSQLAPTYGPQPTLPPATPPQPAPSANYMPPGGNVITLVPGQPAQNDGMRIGDSVTIQLPTGASWRPGTQNPASGSQPIQWIYSGPGQVILLWTAADGSPQQTTMAFYTVSF